MNPGNPPRIRTGAAIALLPVLPVLPLLALLAVFAPSGSPAYAAQLEPGATTPGAPALVVRPDTAKRAPTPMAQLLAKADSALKAQGGSHAGDAQLFLSWDAPWGQKRARRERRPACGDSTVEDTLYLCMKTGRSAERFAGFTAELVVRATGSDTLGAWWHMQGKGGHNIGAMRVEWAALQDWGAPQPFAQQGQGFIMLEPSRAVARMRLIYAVPNDPPVPVAAEPVFALARITLKHMPQRGLPGCARPVVIEWTKATLAFGIKDEPTVARGERFVTFGGPYALSEQFRGLKTQTWKPPAPAKK